MACTYRKNKEGEWVVVGPRTTLAQAAKTGEPVAVTLKSGKVKHERIERVGRGFQGPDGVQLAYGYPLRVNCAECGGAGGVHPVEDLSGIPGYVCGRCARQGGGWSFA